MRIRLVAVAAGIVVLLTACGGVDREGTKEALIESLGDTVSDEQKQCMADTIDEFSDDELKAADDDPNSAEGQAIIAEMLECLA
jgi:hypothetical protein